MKIYTSRYQNGAVIKAMGLVLLGITLGRPRFRLGYQVVYLRELAPDPRTCHINDRERFEPKYRAKLDRLGVDRIRELLERISEEHGGKDLVLLCSENLHKPGEWWHRQIFSAWWQEKTGEVVEELS